MHELDATDVVVRSNGLQLRDLRSDSREADFVASTDSIDRYDEIVKQDWQLERFKKNPVALYAHKSRELPIGVVTRCEVINGQLECTIKFLEKDDNPEAEKVWRCVKAGALRAVSVGFYPHSYSFEKRGDREVLVLSENELLEISVVTVPGNAEALAKAAHEKMKARAMARVAKTEPAETRAEETNMNELELARQAMASKDAELAAVKAMGDLVKKELEDTKAKLAASEKTFSDLALSFKEQGEKLAKVEDELVGLVVEEQNGVKFYPAEKDAMLSLAKKDIGSFKAICEARPVLKTLERVAGTAPLASGTAAPHALSADEQASAALDEMLDEEEV